MLLYSESMGWAVPFHFVGNGGLYQFIFCFFHLNSCIGLSLRSKSKMIEVIRLRNWTVETGPNEDGYFAEGVLKLNHALAPVEVANQFSGMC
jgi:hypothetical protein